jgi:hypothetical protein
VRVDGDRAIRMADKDDLRRLWRKWSVAETDYQERKLIPMG